MREEAKFDLKGILTLCLGNVVDSEEHLFRLNGTARKLIRIRTIPIILNHTVSTATVIII